MRTAIVGGATATAAAMTAATSVMHGVPRAVSSAASAMATAATATVASPDSAAEGVATTMHRPPAVTLAAIAAAAAAIEAPSRGGSTVCRVAVAAVDVATGASVLGRRRPVPVELVVVVRVHVVGLHGAVRVMGAVVSTSGLHVFFYVYFWR